jgi:hypothetical protein
MPEYKKKDGKYWIKPGMFDEWEPLNDYCKRIKKEAVDKSKTWKEKLKAKAIEKIKEI